MQKHMENNKFYSVKPTKYKKALGPCTLKITAAMALKLYLGKKHSLKITMFQSVINQLAL